MKYKKLGDTDLDVSLICLGTMTWGQQNTEEEGHEQMDYAVDRELIFLIPQNFIQFRQKQKHKVVQKQSLELGLRKTIIEKNYFSYKGCCRSGMDWFRGGETRLIKKI